MDSVTRPEFAALFDRISRIVPLKGCYDADMIRERIHAEMHGLKTEQMDAEESYRRGEVTLNWWTWKKEKSQKKYDQLKKLFSRKETSVNDFSDRVINEAVQNPNSIYMMTLFYGRKKAKEIMLARKKQEIYFKVPRRGISRHERYARLHRRV